MTWPVTVLITYFVLNALTTVAMAGRERRMNQTGVGAVVAVVLYTALIWVVLKAGGIA